MEIKKLIKKYLIADFFVSIITWLLFCCFRWVANDILVFNDIPILTPNYNFFLAISFYPICSIFVSYLTGFYDQLATRSRIIELFSTLTGSFISSLITFFVILIDDVVVSYHFYYQSFFVLWGLQFLLMYFVRFCITQNYFSKIKKGTIQFNLLIIGTGATAEKTAQSINNKIRFYGSNLIGFVRTSRRPKRVSGKVVGNISQLESIIKNNNIQNVIIALENDESVLVFDIINDLIKYQNLEISILPRQLEIITGRVVLNDIDSVPLISLSTLSMPAWQRSMKRSFDVVMSIVGIIMLSPYFVYVAIRIKLNSKGPILYKQERIGKGGVPFIIYKFRSMYDNAEKGIPPQLTQADDPRITSYGKFMRKYRIDELPQLFNILKGDMSIVGPRPERAYFIQQIIKEAPYYCLLYKIKPGLLSWGPIKVGYTHSIVEMKERLNYDIIYMDNMSIFNDIKIIVYSIEIVFKGKGI
jgi:exopolysaccharide biosynthesis polyprenyl glycosylphosphotransferase